MIDITPKSVIDMSSWWKKKEASQLLVFAYVDDHFAEPEIQRVIDWEDARDLDSCSGYWTAVSNIREKAGGLYIDSSSIHMSMVKALGEYIMLKAEHDKKAMAKVKTDKIAKLKKELAELELEPAPSERGDEGSKMP